MQQRRHCGKYCWPLFSFGFFLIALSNIRVAQATQDNDDITKAMSEAGAAFGGEKKEETNIKEQKSSTEVNGYGSNRFTFSQSDVGSLIPVNQQPEIIDLLELNVQLRRPLGSPAFFYTDASALLQAGGVYFSSSTAGKRIQVKASDVQTLHPLFVLSEFYLSYSPLPNLNLMIGKKRIVWGSGLTINPTDLLNPPKDPSDATLQRAGAWLFRLELPFDFFTFSAVWAPEVLYTDNGLPYQFLKYPDFPPQATVLDPVHNPDPRDRDYHYMLALRWYMLIKESDINLMYFFSNKYNDAFANKSRLGLSFSRYFFTDWEFHLETLFQQGSNRLYVNGSCVNQGTASVIGCLANKQDVFGQFKLNDPTFYARVLLGVRRTFSEESQLSLEYLYVGDGMTPTEFGNLVRGFSLAANNNSNANAAANALSFSPTQNSGGLINRFTFDPLRRHYLFINYSKPKIGDDWTLGVVILAGLEDLSGVVIPSVTWNAFEWLNLQVTGFVPVRGLKVGEVTAFGRQYSEYGLLPIDARVVFEARAFY